MKRSWSINQNKSSIRQSFKTQRDQLAVAFRGEAAISAASLFGASSLFQQHTQFACYWPHGSELDTREFIHLILNAHKKCYLPVISGEVLSFKQYTKDTLLLPNRFGIMEPAADAPSIAPEALDVVLVPLVAFDKSGNRLGSGAGYYDKTFAFKADKASIKPLLIGLAYACQQTDALPSDPWDIKLDAVLTERQIIL